MPKNTLGQNKDNKNFNIFLNTPITKDQVEYVVNLVKKLNPLLLFVFLLSGVFVTNKFVISGSPVYIFDPVLDFLFVGFISLVAFVKNDFCRKLSFLAVFLFSSLLLVKSFLSLETVNVMKGEVIILLVLALMNFRALQPTTFKKATLKKDLFLAVGLLLVGLVISLNGLLFFYGSPEKAFENYKEKSNKFDNFTLVYWPYNVAVCNFDPTEPEVAYITTRNMPLTGEEYRDVSFFKLNRSNIFSSDWKVSGQKIETAKFDGNVSIAKLVEDIQKDCKQFKENNTSAFKSS